MTVVLNDEICRHFDVMTLAFITEFKQGIIKKTCGKLAARHTKVAQDCVQHSSALDSNCDANRLPCWGAIIDHISVFKCQEPSHSGQQHLNE